MATKTRVEFNSQAWKKALYDSIAEEQTKRLVAYAEDEIKNIGASFLSWDRTGNLLDSLCWGLYINGKVGSNYGFYRKPLSSEDSYLHEYSRPPLRKKVDGYVCAQKFLSSYKPSVKKGWELVFAVCAPYWGYWEEGHENPPHSGRRIQFSVMAERYDHIRSELGSERTTFSVFVPLY